MKQGAKRSKNLNTMKIKWGSIVVNGSGKLGGHVYSKNRGGNYVRTLATPSNPQTPAQQAGRAVFTVLSQGWSALTQAQRDGWNSATDQFIKTDQFGDVRELSGKGLYMSLNKELVLIGQAILSVVPAPGPIVFPGDFNPVMSVAGGTVTMNFETNPPNPGIVVRTSGPVTAGTSFVKNKLRNIAVNDDAVAPEDIYDNFVLKYGIPKVGDRVAFSAYTVNASGQRSPQLTVFTVVVT